MHCSSPVKARAHDSVCIHCTFGVSRDHQNWHNLLTGPHLSDCFTGLCRIDFWATVCKMVCPMLSDHCHLSVLSVCDIGVCCWCLDRHQALTLWPHSKIETSIIIINLVSCADWRLAVCPGTFCFYWWYDNHVISHSLSKFCHRKTPKYAIFYKLYSISPIKQW